jgi:hypothetical protein
VKLNTGDMPPRPDFGTEGMEIKVCADLSWTSSQKLTLCAHQLRANFFAVKLRAPEQPLKFYEAEIAPAAGTAPRRVKRRIWHLAEETPAWTQHGLKGQVAHDHAAKLVSVSALYDALLVFVVNTGVVLTMCLGRLFQTTTARDYCAFLRRGRGGPAGNGREDVHADDQVRARYRHEHAREVSRA